MVYDLRVLLDHVNRQCDFHREIHHEHRLDHYYEDLVAHL
jgi:hypothetical protein